MRILVVDAQGGGLGRALIEKLKGALPEAEIIAVGTNSMATAAMMKAGPTAAATGENAVLYNAARSDLIMGGIGIIGANSMLGEVTPAMAGAISGGGGVKILIPMGRCNLRVAGVVEQPLPARIDAAVAEAKALMEERQ